MTDAETPFTEENGSLLVVRRRIRASVERVFRAWTQPELVMQWWGPEGVTCPAAEIDLRVGGAYRIANLLPDGNTIWITGTFEAISPPERLVYTWRVSAIPDSLQRVTVRFDRHGDETEVVIVHEMIPDKAARELHEHGWIGCLDGLEAFLASRET